MSSDRVIIFDTSLRDGEQAPGAAMTVPEKLQLAGQLARLGVDVIEAGFPISSPGQFEAVRRIVAEVQGPTICALARAKKADIDAAGSALKGGSNTRIHTFIATSDIHLESKFADARYGASLEEKRETVLKMAVEAVEHALTYTNDVEFSAEELIRTVINGVHAPETVVFSTHCHDDLGLAVANSLSGLQAGARQVECTINGIGERAGNAALEEVVMALRVRAPHFGLHTGINPSLLFATSKMVSTFTGFQVQPNKAIIGKNAFAHEAGIHQDGVLKNRETYEIMRAEDVGQDSESIRLGRHSGRHGLFSRLERLGVRVDEKNRADVYATFVELADRKKEINDADLINLFHHEEHTMDTPHYSLEKFHVTVGSGQEPEATVVVRDLQSDAVNEQKATGDGPIDALYRAIDHAVDEGHDLVNYSIRSVSEGSDSFGEVSVLIGIGGPLFAGKASSTDVIEASAQAYMNALNSLAAFRLDKESIEFVGSGIMQAFGNPKE